MIIAIDGTSATGKGTLGRHLAEDFGYAYLDTGALYRTVAFEMAERGIPLDQVQQAAELARQLPFDRVGQLQDSPLIRTEEIGGNASKVAAMPEVRQALLHFQQNFAQNPVLANGQKAAGAVLDGRDIGTVVCPDAKAKIFMTARADVRALRRVKELEQRGLHPNFERILTEIAERDKRDTERKTSPLKPAEDALILDTSDLSIEAVYQKAVDFIQTKK